MLRLQRTLPLLSWACQRSRLAAPIRCLPSLIWQRSCLRTPSLGCKTRLPLVARCVGATAPALKKETATMHLKELNNLFLQSYGMRKAAIKNTLGVTRPVMILHRDHLILKHQGTTSSVKYVPDDYHQIKNIAHIACTIHTLQLLRENDVDTAAMRENLLNRLKAVLNLLANKDAASILKKHEPLLKKYLALLDGKKQATPLLCLAGSLKSLLKEAAVLRTDALHAQVNKLRQQMCPRQWDRLAVIVMGPRMPREGELGMQYAQKMILQADPSLAKLCPHLNGTLTKTSHAFQNKRLIYIESIEEIDRALEELATEICDEILGEAVLGSGDAMRADFLKDAVRDHLRTLKP